MCIINVSMKKIKLLKPTLGIATIGTVAISTSCSCGGDVQVQYFLNGGSLSLQGKASTAGQDEGVWKLYSESQEIETGITWKLTSATAEELPDSIRINDGVVSWTDQIEAGTYRFYVVATYNDKETKTNEINLLITTSSYIEGFEGNKITYYNPFCMEDMDIELGVKQDEYGKTQYYATTPLDVAVMATTYEQNTINFIPIFSESASTYISKNIKYELVFDSPDESYDQIFVYNTNDWVDQTKTPLRFAVFGVLYNKAKIKVTFECDPNVYLIVPINSWNYQTAPNDQFKIPSEKEEEYRDKIIINFDEATNTYSCYFHATDVNNLNSLTPCDISLVGEPGNFLMSEFKIVDIQHDVLENASIDVTKEVIPTDVIIDDKTIPTAYILYNIHIEFVTNGTMPGDSDYRHNLFTINENNKGSPIARCNFIWWFKN